MARGLPMPMSSTARSVQGALAVMPWMVAEPSDAIAMSSFRPFVCHTHSESSAPEAPSS